jgi:hypothetical protein
MLSFGLREVTSEQSGLLKFNTKSQNWGQAKFSSIVSFLGDFDQFFSNFRQFLVTLNTFQQKKCPKFLAMKHALRA